MTTILGWLIAGSLALAWARERRQRVQHVPRALQLVDAPRPLCDCDGWGTHEDTCNVSRWVDRRRGMTDLVITCGGCGFTEAKCRAIHPQGRCCCRFIAHYAEGQH